MRSRSTVPQAAVDQVDTSYLESLVGYNARRASLAIVDLFLHHMAAYELRPVDFSVLSLITHNPGITSRQLCSALSIQPPNLVGLIGQLLKRELIVRKPHPHDGRAVGLHLSPQGRKLMKQAERSATQLELDASRQLSASERKVLIQLLKKIYE